MKRSHGLLALALLVAGLSPLDRARGVAAAVPDRSVNVRKLGFAPVTGNLVDAVFWKDLVIVSRRDLGARIHAWYEEETGHPVDQASDCPRMSIEGVPWPFPPREPDRCPIHLGSTKDGPGHNGFDILRILPGPPFIEHVSTFHCRDLSEHGSISVWRHWVFMSVAAGSGAPACRSPREDGIVVVDIEDPRAPEMEMFIKTSCATGTHSLLPAGDRLYLYGGGHNNVRDTCNSDSPLPSGDIEVIRFSPGDPPSARVVARPAFDVATGCHDLTVLPGHDLAACSDPPYNLNLLDIRDPVNPTELASVGERSSIGTPPMLTWGGEGLIDYEGENQGTCTPTADPSRTGGLHIYSTRSDPPLQRLGSFRLERLARSPCSFTSGNVIPMRDGRDVVVTSWLRGGMSLIDFTDASAPMEIAHWMLEGTQVDAAYWYNGRIYLVETGTANDSEIGVSTSPPGVRIQHGGPDAVVSPAPSGIRVLDVAGYGEEATRLFRNGYNNRSQIADFVRDDPPRRTKGKCRRGKRGPGRRCRPKATSAAP